MSVKKKDRSISNKECLNNSRKMFQQLLSLTKPKTLKIDGTWTRNGILGYGQPYEVFGIDFLKKAKRIHTLCLLACDVKLKNEASKERKDKHFNEAIELCDSILHDLDLCIQMYGTSNARKKSLGFFAKLTKDTKESIKLRQKLDGYILQNKQYRHLLV